jgi:uncharacterized damage-inducible protein DinB
MRNLFTGKLICLAVVCLSAGMAMAQQHAPEAPHTIGGELDTRLKSAEHEVLLAAEAMPEGKYSFAPTSGNFKGVRTFSEQLKHVGVYNFRLCSSIRQERAPVDTTPENGPESMKSKAEIISYLKEGFAYCHQALNTINDKNAVEVIRHANREATRMSLAAIVVSHPFDHYGQMVVYLRMNGIVPPGTQQRQAAMAK